MSTCNDLATKAELQELRDQLNAVLGKKEDGGIVQVFTAGAAGLLVASLLGDTSYALAQERAANSIKEIALTKANEAPIWQQLKEGTAKWTTTKGNGIKVENQGLNTVGKLTGQNTATTAAASKAAAANANAVALLANLASIGATLAINIATVKVLDKRIEAEARGARQQIDAVNQGMIRLFQKQQGDIGVINQGLEDNKTALQNNRQQTDLLRLDVLQVESANQQLQARIDQIEADATTTQQEIQAVKEEIEAFEAEVQEVTDNLKADIAKTEASVESALASIQEQKKLITTAFEEIEIIKTEVANLDERVSKVEIEIDELQDEFEQLKQDLEPDVELLQAQSKLQEARLVILENKTRLGSGGGGSPIGVNQGLVNSQNSLLQLANKLNATQTDVEELTIEETLNDPDAFTTKFNNLLQGVQTGDMSPEQLQELKTGLGTDFSLLLNTAVLPRLDDLSLQSQAPQFRNLVEQGLCQSLNQPGSCPAVPGNPNPTNGLQGMQQAAQSRMDAILAAMGAADLLQGQSILGIVKNTNQVINSSEHGLAKVQDFASKAWKATKADKIMNALTTAVVIHNAMMLSNNLAQTISEATNLALDALGIKDESDNPIDIGAAIRDKINAILSSLLGEANYKALTTRLAAANRIYQASANVYNLIREIGDTSRSITEVACENTGKIGNALLESGAVYENAYDKMIDSVNPQSKAQLKLEKFRNGTEILENAADAISSISSDVIELQELRTELTEGKAQLDAARQAYKTLSDTEKTQIKAESQAETDVNKPDFAKDESDNP